MDRSGIPLIATGSRELAAFRTLPGRRPSGSPDRAAGSCGRSIRPRRRRVRSSRERASSRRRTADPRSLRGGRPGAAGAGGRTDLRGSPARNPHRGIKVKEGDQVSQGSILAILEGHDAAGTSSRWRAPGRRSPTVSGTLAWPRPARRPRLRKPVWTRRTLLYKQFGAHAQGQGPLRRRAGALPGRDAVHQDRSRPPAIGGRGQDPKSGQSRQARQARPGDRGPEDEILDAQVALAEAGLKEAEVRAPTPGASSASWLIRASSARAPCWRWATSPRWSPRPRSTRATCRESVWAIRRRSISSARASRERSRGSARSSARTG